MLNYGAQKELTKAAKQLNLEQDIGDEYLKSLSAHALKEKAANMGDVFFSSFCYSMIF
jgi:hypothetical protein